MTLAAAGAVALAAALDRLLSEPPDRLHPVAWLGRAVGGLDARLPDSRRAGIVLVVTFPTGFAVILAVPVLVLGRLDAPLAAAAAGLVLFVCSSHRMLVAVAGDVIDLTDPDVTASGAAESDSGAGNPAATRLDAARRELRALAGRDATDLSAARIRSAAVESAAENLADGLIAPLTGFAVGSTVGAAAGLPAAAGLALAAGGAAWVKGVNTLDSMLGYRDRRTGWAPARLDDVVMWVPARISAVLIAVVGGGDRPTTPVTTLRRARSATRSPASPNSGWPMASLAAVLGVRLEKPGAYTLLPERSLPTAAEADAGVRVVARAGWLGVGVTGVSLAL